MNETMYAVRKDLRGGIWEELPKFTYVRQKLANVGKLVLSGSRTCIPENVQQQVINLAHEGHRGIVKCKQRLRESVVARY